MHSSSCCMAVHAHYPPGGAAVIKFRMTVICQCLGEILIHIFDRWRISQSPKPPSSAPAFTKSVALRIVFAMANLTRPATVVDHRDPPRQLALEGDLARHRERHSQVVAMRLLTCPIIHWRRRTPAAYHHWRRRRNQCRQLMERTILFGRPDRA